MAADKPSRAPGRLRIVNPADLTIRRVGRGRGFAYIDDADALVRDRATLERIRSLVIPPAYCEVRIATDPRTHLQAIGRDEAGRLQYLYHPEWERVRERRKLKRLRRLIEALPRLRRAVADDLKARPLCRRKALACAVAIIDRCHLRIGGEPYAKSNGSHGASTLLKRHVELTASRIDLLFRGKGGKQIACSLQDGSLARALGRIAALPGRRLLQYRDDDGTVVPVHAADINAYLREVSGLAISAKDLRMLAGNAAAAELLLASQIITGDGSEKRQLAEVMRAVSEQLANTPAVTRKSYVHAIVVNAYANGKLAASFEKVRAGGGCSRIERALALLAA
ncbi:DNA topoisomerase IB [Bosea sp. LC85]|uniref:DNA topoisomerase IB n=1 Tax=Bosea sp. LC85 TaxID=1502851 RepID=UPI0004E2D385|nr:DNA topoisomerase IB [Bosea sp. LC85]KFC72766.1 DNA topoisomerase IB [Bosea sp. LC85]